MFQPCQVTRASAARLCLGSAVWQAHISTEAEQCWAESFSCWPRSPAPPARQSAPPAAHAWGCRSGCNHTRRTPQRSADGMLPSGTAEAPPRHTGRWSPARTPSSTGGPLCGALNEAVQVTQHVVRYDIERKHTGKEHKMQSSNCRNKRGAHSPWVHEVFSPGKPAALPERQHGQLTFGACTSLVAMLSGAGDAASGPAVGLAPKTADPTCCATASAVTSAGVAASAETAAALPTSAAQAMPWRRRGASSAGTTSLCGSMQVRLRAGPRGEGANGLGLSAGAHMKGQLRANSLYTLCFSAKALQTLTMYNYLILRHNTEFVVNGCKMRRRLHARACLHLHVRLF